MTGTVQTADLNGRKYIGGTQPGYRHVSSSGFGELKKTNFSAIVDPVVTDDSGDGYSVGSIWINTTLDKAFLCTDASAGASVWADLTASTPVGGISGQVLFNNAGSIGGIVGSTWDGTTLVTPNLIVNGTTLIGVQAGATNDGFDLILAKSRGSVSVPTVITTGDQLGAINFQGYSGAAGYVTGAQIRAVSEGTIATTRVPTKLVFATGTDAAPTVLTDRLTIDSGGYFQVTGKIGINYASGTNALTVLDDIAAPIRWGSSVTPVCGSLSYGGTGNATLLFSGAALPLSIGTNGSANDIFIDTAGLVGINKTASLAAQLDIVASSSTTVGQLITGATSHSVPLLRVKCGGGTPVNNVFEVTNSSETAYVSVGPPVLAGDSATKNFFNVTGTSPAVLSNTLNGVNFTITGAGSSGQFIRALNVDLVAGYTGSEHTSAGYFNNASAGTSTAFGYGNVGVSANVLASAVGTNSAITAYARSGNLNYGVHAQAVFAKDSATNIGVAGFALNTGTTPIHIAGYFGLQAATPTFASAALMCDNGATTSDIFVARDNGTAVFKIVDGGTIAGTIQRAKANYNNWAALTDVVAALVATGLFDTA